MSRLLLGLGLLSVSVMSPSMIVALLLLFVLAVLLRVLDGHVLTSLRLLRLLRWFLIPILLLHALFTPGQLLMPELLIPISREGVVQGVILSLHLGAVFFAAMLMFRLLKQAEWLHYILLWPYLGQRLTVYVWMMNGMRMSITALLHDFRAQFRWRKDWPRAPLLLMSAFKQVLADASEHACMLWLRWPALMPVEANQASPTLQYCVVSLLLGSMGCATLLYVCL
ncbi:MAG: hypothetical protein JKY87_06395 [Mariprofundus sp.]|nr:hypothetical protein [Mariprofundus sp.]